MAASYPGSLKTFTTKSNLVDLVDASHINDLQLEVAAIETELGTDIAGSVTDLVTRLTVLLNDDGTIKVIQTALAIDITNTEAFLVRKNSDAEDVFTVDTTNRRISANGFLSLAGKTELTIATGVVTAVRSFHSIDTQDDDATDDLVTINGGVEGDILVIHAANSTRTVVVKDGSGNVFLEGDFSMDHNQDRLSLLQGTSGNWFETGRSSNA